jgi:hypothetical protein
VKWVISKFAHAEADGGNWPPGRGTWEWEGELEREGNVLQVKGNGKKKDKGRPAKRNKNKKEKRGQNFHLQKEVVVGRGLETVGSQIISLPEKVQPISRARWGSTKQRLRCLCTG